MKDTAYVVGFLAFASLLLYVGRDNLPSSELLTWGISFGATGAVAVLGVSLYRVQTQLQLSRQELARKNAELHFARETQQALFPSQPPRGIGLEFSAVCIPAQGISGDYYDILELPGGRVVFALADVSGKGIPAALLMANLHAFLRIGLETSETVVEACSRLNRHLFKVTEPSKYATLFLAEWHPTDHKLFYVNAGHQTPILVGSSKRKEPLLEGGPPVGLFEDIQYSGGESSLSPGETMVLFSDGVIEAPSADGEEFGEKRLRRIVERNARVSAAELQGLIISEVRQWSKSYRHDDTTVVIVKPLQSVMDGSPPSEGKGAEV